MPAKKPIVPMTPKQQQLAEDNHNLIYGYARSRGLRFDDWYDDLAYALCYAAQNYTPERGSFSTFAYICFTATVRRRLARDKRRKRLVIVSLDAPAIANPDDERSNLEDFISAEDRHFELTEWRMLEQQLIKRMTQGEKDVWELRKQQLTQKQIAARLNVSHQAVGQRLKQIEKKAKTILTGMQKYD